MALKFKFKSKNEIPVDQLPLYAERDGAWVLDVEGAVDKSKLDEFRTTNVALVKERDELKQRFEASIPMKCGNSRRRARRPRRLACSRGSHLITQGILDFMTDPSFRFLDPTASLYSLQATFAVAVAGFWIVFSTLSAPLVTQKVIAAGELAGGQLIAGAFSGPFQTTATTAGAAAVAGSMGLTP